MNNIMDQLNLNGKWFSEINKELWPGQCMSLQVDRILHDEHSPYQHIQVLQTTHHGRALILDNIIQCTEFDEFAYQEMMALVPLCAHPRPRRVLIVGGGDGGVAREVVKHPHVERVTQVEIDGRVIAAAKQHLPFMSAGFEHPKVEVIVGDGFEYMRQQRAAFDAIITDSSDPIGPAESLFTADYFALLAGALRDGGVICSQGGSVWNGLQHVAQTLRHCRQHFANVRYALVAVPTYPSGQIGLTVASKDTALRLDEAQYVFPQAAPDGSAMRYYDERVHTAAFVLPKFAQHALFSI